MDATGLGHRGSWLMPPGSANATGIGLRRFPLDHDRMAWDIRGSFPLDLQGVCHRLILSVFMLTLRGHLGCKLEPPLYGITHLKLGCEAGRD